MGDELKFQQRWDYRRREDEFDSSSNDSKYSLGGKPAYKKHKLALVPVDNDETSEVSRSGKKGKNDPAISGKVELGMAAKGQRGQNKKENVAKKRISRNRKVTPQKKGKTNVANENAALNDLKNHMHSLLEELKVTRENLMSWMREEMKKLVAEEKDSKSEKKKDGIFKGDPVQFPYQNSPEENEQIQYQNLSRKNIQQIQPQNKLEEYGQMQTQNKFAENFHMQHLISLEEKNGLIPQKNYHENVQLQSQNKVRSCTRARTCNAGPSKRNTKSKKQVDSDNHAPAHNDQVDYSRAIVLVSPTEENREERLALPHKSNSKSIVLDQNVQVQQEKKSIVLAIRARNGNTSSPWKSVKGKKPAGSSNNIQLPDYQVNYSQTIGSLASAEKDKGDRSGLSIEPNFVSDSFNQGASSSMYLTLPSVLTKTHFPIHRPDTSSSFSYLQQLTAPNQPAISSERSNMIFGSSSHHLGYFQPAEERNRNYTKLSSRDISFFNQNNPSSTSLMGNGFTVPLQTVGNGFSIPNQFDLENLPRDNNNNTLGLTMNGGAIRFSGGSYSLPDPYISNNLHSLSNYIVDGRLMKYEESFRFPNRFNC